MKRPVPDRAFSARVDRHLEAASIFDAAIDESTTSRPVVAAQLEISPQDLRRVCDPTTGRAVPLEHVLGLPDDAYRAVVEALADRAGLGVVALPEASSESDDLRSVAETQREASEAITAALLAVADGHITRSEGAKLESECDEAIARLLAVRERARLAQREGVIAIRRSA